MTLVKRLLLLATLLAVVLPGTAGAAGHAAGTPCRNKVVSDWYRDGKIASSYPISCYRDALKHIPADADIYSSLRQDVRSAMRAAIQRRHGVTVPRQVGHGAKATGAGSVKSALVSIAATKTHYGSPPAGGGASATGVVATASGTPLPVLLLGGLALALVAAGAVGAGVRHARNRRG